MVSQSHLWTSAAPAASAVEIRRPWRISWGGIWAGLFVVFAVQVVLDVLSLGVGFSVVTPSNGSVNAGGLGVAGAVWWGVSYLIAAFLGGYVAARLAETPNGWDGALHGFVTWAFALTVTLLLLSVALGNILSGTLRAASGIVSSAAQGVESALPAAVQTMAPGSLQQSAKELLNPQPNNANPQSLSPAEAQQQIAANLPKLAQGGQAAQQARDRVVAIIAAQLHVSTDEANRRLDQITQQARQAASNVASGATQAASSAAGGLSVTFLGIFGALLVGAICAGLGGAVGTRSTVVP